MAKRKRVVKTVKRKTHVVKRTQKSYSVEYKKKVIAYARNHGNNQAARHFDIDRGMVSSWVSASSKWTSETKKKSRRVGSGRKALFPRSREKALYLDHTTKKTRSCSGLHKHKKQNVRNLKRIEMMVLYGNVSEDFKMS